MVIQPSVAVSDQRFLTWRNEGGERKEKIKRKEDRKGKKRAPERGRGKAWVREQNRMAREWEGVDGRSAVPRWLQTRQTYNTASSSPLSSFPYHFYVASHSLLPLIPTFNFAPLFNFVPLFHFDSFSSFLSLFAPSSPLRHYRYPYHSFYYENLWSLYFHFTRRHLNFSFFIFWAPLASADVAFI